MAAGVITGSAAVCQSQSGVSFSVPAITNATGYIWTLPAGATIATGANTNSITVDFSAVSTSGNVTVQGSNACGNGTLSGNFAVTVNPLPVAAGVITGSAAVCQLQSGVSFSVPAITNATGYIWTLPAGATIATGANTNSITVDFSAVSTSGNVTVQGSNACGNGTLSGNFAVTVNPLPVAAGVITGSAAVCQSQGGVSFSVPAITNATGYIWTLPAGATIATGANTNSITVDFSVVSTSGNVTVQGSNACGNGTLSGNFAVTVNPLPVAAGVITGSAAVCQLQSGVSFSVPAITNATGYIWTLPAGATIATGANTNSITVDFSAVSTSGNVTVQGSNACGNGTLSGNFAVTVNPLPVAAGVITGSAAVCQAQGGVSFSVPAITNATGYIWTLPAGATIATGANTNSITVDFSAVSTSGNVTVQGSNACGNGTLSGNFAVTVNPLPVAAGVITGSAAVCQSQGGVSFSVPAITNATGYIWTLPAGATIATGANTNSITVDFSAVSTSGNVTVQGSNACGNGTLSGNYAVTVNPLPVAAGVITGSAAVCQSQGGVSFSVPAITNATGYIWTLPAGATIATGANTNSITVDFSAVSTSGNVTVQGSNACGNGTVSGNFAVTVNPLPVAAGVITGSAAVCQSQGGVSFSVPAITNATGYIWTLPAGATIATGANTNSITVDFSAVSTSGNVTVQGSNACGNGTLSGNFAVTVNPLPVAAGVITGSAAVCQLQSGVSFSVPAITNATGYIWTLPAGATIATGANTNSITVDFSAVSTSGNVTVQGSNACGNGTLSGNFAVTVNPLPVAAGVITGSAAVCQAQGGVSFSVPAITNATGYIWTLPAGATIATGANTNSITVDFSAVSTSGNVTVQGSNACGNGTLSGNFAVTVNPLPVAAGVITGSAAVCQSQGGVSFSVPAITNATGYIWTLPAGATIATGANTNSITVDFSAVSTSGNVTVQGSNACGNGTLSGNYAVTVNPLPVAAGVITGSAAVCQSQGGVSFSVPAITNATGYIWTLPAGATIATGANTNSITVDFSAVSTSGNVTVQGSNACGNGTVSGNFAVTVNPLPVAAGVITGSAAVCQSQGGVSFSVPAITNATGYIWTLPAGATIATGANTNSITVDFSAVSTSGNVTVQGSNACGNGTVSGNFLITVNQIPVAVISSNSPVCAGSSIDLLAQTVAGATYNWTGPNGFSSTSQNPSIPSALPVDSGTYSLVISNNGCVSATSNQIIAVNNCGGADLSISQTVSNAHPIIGSTIVFSINVTDNGPSSSTGVIVTDPLQSGYTYISSNSPTGDYDPATGIWTVGSLNNGATDSLTITVTVNQIGPYDNTATVTGNEPDGNLLNNVSWIITYPTDFFIPEGFSPNGDGINDVFIIRGILNFPDNSIIIFNRWGNKVFEASPYLNNWDGKATMGLRIGGGDLPVGTYFYVFDKGDGTKIIKGTIYLNR